MALIVRDSSNMFAQMSGMPINSQAGRDLLKKSGINTNSVQYKKVISSMYESMGGAGAVGYTTTNAIKNRMKNYDSDGNWINPVNGLAGLCLNEKGASVRNRIISIPDSSKDEMFELTKKEFLRDNGSSRGETGRTEVYNNLYRKMEKSDRLPAGYTLQEHEKAYTEKMVSIAKAYDPDWEAGRALSYEARNAIKSLTREDVEEELKF